MPKILKVSILAIGLVAALAGPFSASAQADWDDHEGGLRRSSEWHERERYEDWHQHERFEHRWHNEDDYVVVAPPPYYQQPRVVYVQPRPVYVPPPFGFITLNIR